MLVVLVVLVGLTTPLLLFCASVAGVCCIEDAVVELVFVLLFALTFTLAFAPLSAAAAAAAYCLASWALIDFSLRFLGFLAGGAVVYAYC